jgi:lambda family phage minor tail protein L
MLSLSSAAIIEKNKLSTNTNWIILLEIQLTDGQVIRVCRNTENVLWGGEEWVAFPFTIDDISEQSAGEEPQLTVSVGNQTRAIQSYIEDGNGGVGATVTIRVVFQKYYGQNTYLEDVDGAPITDVEDDYIYLIHTAEPSVELEYEYVCTGCTATSEWVTFTLGASNNNFRRAFPRHKAYKNICRWKFKSPQCGYTGTEFDTCPKTLAACRERGNSTRYGGFPSIGTGALYV